MIEEKDSGNDLIRRLEENDWRAWQAIRLEGLQHYPHAFASSFEDEQQQSEQEIKDILQKSDIFGVFADAQLIGVAKFSQLQGRKLQHRGMLTAVYLKRAFHGRGIGDRLLGALIEHARPKVLQLHCTVETNNTAAIRLYQRHGFQIYGTEPRALNIGDQFHDEHLMVLQFGN